MASFQSNQDSQAVRRTSHNQSHEPIHCDVIVIGAGVSGLACAKSLIQQHSISPSDIMICEAQDYVGGRLLQTTNFVKGVKVELGGEILHGSDTSLTRFARENNEPIQEIYCWAHGDGGPGKRPIGNGYGLYYLSNGEDGKKLLRYDDVIDEDFVKINDMIWNFSSIDESQLPDSMSVVEYLKTQGITKQYVFDLVAAGFSNTMCTNSNDLSIRQMIKWCRAWDEESPQDEDYKFKNSFSCLIDYLKAGVNIRTSFPITSINYSNDKNELIRMTAADGTKLTCRAVVVSASIHVLKSGILGFNPPLPEEKLEALSCCDLYRAMKIYLKFKRCCWPKDLQGMIMSGDNCLIPEAWFRDVTNSVATYNEAASENGLELEEATAYATGFATAKYAETLSKMSEAEVYRVFLAQLKEVFGHLEHRHMAADLSCPNVEPADSIPNPFDVFIGGHIQHWDLEHTPYIGGGFSAPRAGKPTDYPFGLAKSVEGKIFFCGEATHFKSGGTAHAAMDSGVRAAGEVNVFLSERVESDSD